MSEPKGRSVLQPLAQSEPAKLYFWHRLAKTRHRFSITTSNYSQNRLTSCPLSLHSPASLFSTRRLNTSPRSSKFLKRS